MAGSAQQRDESIETVSRRRFLCDGTLALVGTGLSSRLVSAQPQTSRARAVIHLMMVGGPSQLETFDPKPDAPELVRGPMGSIATTVPGVRINEHLPEIARRMNRLTLIRSISHNEAPIHETGLQLLQTGRLSRLDDEAPHYGAVAARMLGQRGSAPAFVVLPERIGPTGVAISQGQRSGLLGPEYEPIVMGAAGVARLVRETARADEPESVRDAYGSSAFARDCLHARQLVEAGSRVVTVNMAASVFNRLSWDCHGSAPFSTFNDYATKLLPMFDRAFSALVDDLDRLGMLDSTLVIATGEFGRAPRINAQGGRDHWTGASSGLLAGAGFSKGAVIGATDKNGGEVVDRPVHPSELVATAYRSLGINPTQLLTLGDGRDYRLMDESVVERSLLA